jgi:hypothetical protein
VNTANGAGLTQSEAELLDRAGDVLIPAADPMPSVSQSDRDRYWLDRACRARPDLVDAVRALLKRFPRLDSLEAIATAQQQDEAGVAALLSLTAGRYYMNHAVRRLLDYPGQTGRSPDLPVYGWERAAELVERVADRGQIYREAL